jgi:hypothetical protein
MLTHRARILLSVLPIVLAAIALAPPAHADALIIREPDRPLIHRIEIEPHGVLSWGEWYGNTLGFGPGLRASITLGHHLFIPRLNNSIAISFGGDIMYYPDCYWRYYGYYVGGACNTWVLFFPVALQWNFFLTSRWSVFIEPGLAFYWAIFDDPACTGGGCPGNAYRPSHFGLSPAVFAGARLHFNEHVSLTMRIGYPYASIGVSFF